MPVALAESLAGRRDLVIVTLHDLTPLRRIEEMRVDFVANASHELRTPLASLSGFIDTLQGPARDDPAARERFLAIMKQQAMRMARLIDDLLSLSRIELKAHVQPNPDGRPRGNRAAGRLTRWRRSRASVASTSPSICRRSRSWCAAIATS